MSFAFPLNLMFYHEAVWDHTIANEDVFNCCLHAEYNCVDRSLNWGCIHHLALFWLRQCLLDWNFNFCWNRKSVVLSTLTYKELCKEQYNILSVGLKNVVYRCRICLEESYRELPWPCVWVNQQTCTWLMNHLHTWTLNSVSMLPRSSKGRPWSMK